MRKGLVILALLLVVSLFAMGCGGKVYRPEVTAYVTIEAPAGHEVERDGNFYTIRPIEGSDESEESVDPGSRRAKALRWMDDNPEETEGDGPEETE